MVRGVSGLDLYEVGGAGFTGDLQFTPSSQGKTFPPDEGTEKAVVLSI